MILYDKKKYDNLIFKFNESEKIEQNYSQAYQDIFVLTMLDGKRNGTFLEIGASHESINSNTYLLEKNFNWGGVSIDIDTNSKKSFVNRKNTNFILENALNINYVEVIKKYYSNNIIDYLQIDIEPQKQTLNCLKLIPFDEYQFSVITFETDLYDPKISKEESLKNQEESRSFLKNKGYELIIGNICNISESDPFEDWYINPLLISKEIINLFKSIPNFNKQPEHFFLKK